MFPCYVGAVEVDAEHLVGIEKQNVRRASPVDASLLRRAVAARQEQDEASRLCSPHCYLLVVASVCIEIFLLANQISTFIR